MKPNISKSALSLLLALSAFVSAAQELDPTVVVDRAYEGKLIEVHKPQLQMAVPDTVMQFALDFDYSVFESPYKGSYEFSPYLLSLKPDVSKNESNTLYLRAGAGYAFHPVVDAVWSPRLNGKFGVDMYASHNSFVGTYRTPGGEWNGYDLLTKVGADASYDWNKGEIGLEVGYKGIAVKDRYWRHSLNALETDFSVASKVTRDNGFVYRVDASWKMSGDRAHGNLPYSRLSENVFDVKAVLGPAFHDFHRMLFDVGVELVNYSGADCAGASQFYVVPHYAYKKGRMYFDFGVRFAKIMDNDGNDPAYRAEKLEQMVYPDVSFEFALIPEALKLYAGAGGGNELNTFTSLLERNHHLNVSLPLSSQLDYSVERLSADIGLEGRVTSRFSYNMRGGYVIYGNGLLDAVLLGENNDFLHAFGYGKWMKGFLELSLGWHGESVSAAAFLQYTDAWGKAFETGTPFLLPAAFTGDVSVEYNWKKRIFAGVDCSFATVRKGELKDIPGYADLGIYAEYAASRRLAFWMRGGNLLGMNIQRSPLYAEKGPYFTFGMCFKY